MDIASQEIIGTLSSLCSDDLDLVYRPGFACDLVEQVLEYRIEASEGAYEQLLARVEAEFEDTLATLMGDFLRSARLMIACLNPEKHLNTVMTWNSRLDRAEALLEALATFTRDDLIAARRGNR